MSDQTIAVPEIEATPSAPVSPPSDQQTAPIGAQPIVVEGEIVGTVDDYEPPPRRWRVRALVAVLAVLSLALGAMGGLFISPLVFASATITLTPESHELATAASIPVTVRLYPASPERLSQSITATGTATRPATAAHGSITFYNGLPAPQTVAAGTLLMSANSVAVVTEEDAYVPGASPPTEGSATVPARAENVGAAGNIAAGSIAGPCCRAYILAYNGAFWGGADARTYRTPTTEDIANVLAPLGSQLNTRAHGAIHTWLRPGEVLLTPKCQTTTTTSAQPGDEASHVTVTVGETCSAAAYTATDVQHAAADWLSTMASRQFGPVYRLASGVRSDVTGATVSGNRATLRLQLSGRYSYNFTPQALARLRTELAGVNVSRARAQLERIDGITQAQIQSSGSTLPSDPSRIHILLAQ